MISKNIFLMALILSIPFSAFAIESTPTNVPPPTFTATPSPTITSTPEVNGIYEVFNFNFEDQTHKNNKNSVYGSYYSSNKVNPNSILKAGLDGDKLKILEESIMPGEVRVVLVKAYVMKQGTGDWIPIHILSPFTTVLHNSSAVTISSPSTPGTYVPAPTPVVNYDINSLDRGNLTTSFDYFDRGIGDWYVNDQEMTYCDLYDGEREPVFVFHSSQTLTPTPATTEESAAVDTPTPTETIDIKHPITVLESEKYLLENHVIMFSLDLQKLYVKDPSTGNFVPYSVQDKDELQIKLFDMSHLYTSHRSVNNWNIGSSGTAAVTTNFDLEDVVGYTMPSIGRIADFKIRQTGTFLKSSPIFFYASSQELRDFLGGGTVASDFGITSKAPGIGEDFYLAYNPDDITGKLDAGNVAFNDIFINYVLPGICVGYLTPSGTSTSASVFTPGITFRPFVFPLLIDTIFGNKSDAGHQIADNISFFLGFYNLQEPVYGFAITPLTFDLLQVNQSSNQPAN
jgi:hypothetical protein